jgi:hypothetical protein
MATGPVDLEGQQPTQLRCDLAPEQVLLGHAEARQVLQRQVDAPAVEVLGDVASVPPASTTPN